MSSCRVIGESCCQILRNHIIVHIDNGGESPFQSQDEPADDDEAYDRAWERYAKAGEKLQEWQ
jgi:hypothetical protein